MNHRIERNACILDEVAPFRCSTYSLAVAIGLNRFQYPPTGKVAMQIGALLGFLCNDSV